LSLGQQLWVPFQSSPQSILKQITFEITELKPEKACLCVNTDIEVTIAPLNDEIAKEAVLRKRNLLTSDAPSLEWLEEEKGQFMSQIKSLVKQNETLYYQVILNFFKKKV
jgi:hypothetical protein